jgi:hypothetical protein
MLLLVTSAHPTLQRYDQAHLGRLIQPRHYSSIEQTAASGMPWAADNDAFGNFDAVAFDKMLDRIAGLEGCLFVSCPDVVGDHRATFERYASWAPGIRRRGLPLALVAQDGLLPDAVPWWEIDALFIGGTTSWKMGGEVVRLCESAREHRKWLHFGRVNSRKRLDYARFLGCDSADGQQWAKWRDTYLPAGLEHLSGPTSLEPEAPCV